MELFITIIFGILIAALALVGLGFGIIAFKLAIDTLKESKNIN